MFVYKSMKKILTMIKNMSKINFFTNKIKKYK